MPTINLELVNRFFSVAPSAALIPGELTFSCNVCGTSNKRKASSIERESGDCRECGSTVRFRSLAATLTKRLYEKVVVLDDIKANQGIVGIGMSDARCYSSRLKSKFDYTNTFYHCEPLLDITNPSDNWIGANDFVITSDVFEHVAPPVQLAFDNLYSMLKPGGFVVFSVPFTLENDSREHYPNLYKFSIHKDSKNTWVLNNTTVDGQSEEFRNLVFHGGPGTTLEMRLFSLSALRNHFNRAGFVDFQVHNEAIFEHGIFWLTPWSITISALRPKG